MDFYEEERERVLEALKINRGAFQWNVEGLCLQEIFGESEESSYITTLSNVGTCN